MLNGTNKRTFVECASILSRFIRLSCVAYSLRSPGYGLETIMRLHVERFRGVVALKIATVLKIHRLVREKRRPLKLDLQR